VVIAVRVSCARKLGVRKFRDKRNLQNYSSKSELGVKMKITVLGAGSIGRRHLRGLESLKNELGIEELRVYDPNPERISQALAEAPTIVSSDGMESAVTGADALFFCMPTSLHIPCFNEAKDYGVFSAFFEKPLSHSIAGCEQMLRDQSNRERKVVVGYMLHYHPVLNRAKQIIASGQLGRILSVRAEAGFYLPNWHPWEDYRDFYMSDKLGGGGALLDISHEINYLQWLFGDIVEVQGLMATISDLEITSDDFSAAICKFRNGIIGQIQLDLLQFEESRNCKVIGTRGIMNFDLVTNEIRCNAVDNFEWNVEKVDVEFDKIYHVEYRNVINHFRAEDSYVVSGDIAYDTMQVVEAIRRSSAFGARVALPLYD
jgi:predicted dehydrogenase